MLSSTPMPVAPSIHVSSFSPVVPTPRMLIPEQAAHRFRDDAAHLFRLIAARHSD
jgi:hypothetical protein